MLGACASPTPQQGAWTVDELLLKLLLADVGAYDVVVWEQQV